MLFQLLLALGWQLWATGRLMAAARNYLFPLYASLLTPWWMRLLGAKVGRGTEISTALLTPKFTVVADGAFLADDTMVASYELGGGEMSQHLLGYLYVNRLIQPKDDEERIRLVAFSRLREPWGHFLHDIE